MENPYETPLSPRAKPDLKRWVFRYTFACALLLVVGVCSALPGLVLLNQELGWIPVNGKIYDIEISGESVRLETAMRNSLTTGSMLGAIGLLFGFNALLNWRYNRHLQAMRPENTTAAQLN